MQLWLVLIASFSAVAVILMGLQLLETDGEEVDDRDLTGSGRVGMLSDDERAAKLRLAAGSRWTFMRSLFHSHYHTFAAYLQGDDYEWVTGPERLLRLGLLFLVLSAFVSRPPLLPVSKRCAGVVCWLAASLLSDVARLLQFPSPPIQQTSLRSSPSQAK